MRNIHRLMVLGFVLALGIPAAAETDAAPAAAARDEAHQLVILRIIRAVSAAELAVTGMRQLLANPQRGMEVPALMHSVIEQELTAASVERRIVPVYARHLNPAEAVKIDRFLRTAAGLKLQAIWRARAVNPEAPADLSGLSVADQRVVEAFSQTSAGKAMTSLDQRAAADLSIAFRRWSDDIGRRKWAAILDQLLKNPDAPIETGGDSPETALLRQFARILLTMSHDLAKANEEYAKAAAKDEIALLLRPERLVLSARVSEGHKAIAVLQAALGKKQMDVESALARASRSTSELPFKPEYRKAFIEGFERGLERSYAHQLAFGENQRRLLELIDRVLSLAERHFGVLKFEDGNLIFPDTESLATYRSLISTIQDESRREQDLIEKSMKAASQTMLQRVEEEAREKEREQSQAAQASTSDSPEKTATMDRLAAEIDKAVGEYSKRPRVKFFGSRTDEYRFAKYLEDWRQKVEHVAADNYPQAARGKLYGSLVLTVAIGADGSLSKPPEINRSSGHKILDDAAVNIVQIASPYASFPTDIQRDTDIIVITRTWSFTRDDKVSPR